MTERMRLHDPILLLLGVLATLVGFVFIFDAGFARSIDVGRGVIPREFVTQVGASALALVLYSLVIRVDPQTLRKLGPLLWAGAILALMVVLVVGSSENGGAKRAMVLAGIRIQPSEFSKLAAILFLAGAFASRKPLELPKVRDFFDRMDYVVVPTLKRWLPAFFLGVGALLIEKGKDLGTCCVVICIAFAAALIGGVRGRSIAICVVGIAVLTSGLVISEPYRATRFFAFFSRWDDKHVKNEGFQTTMAEVGIASGKWFGVGLGNGVVKQQIPEPTNDFIWATVGEETGVVGSLLVLGLLAALVGRIAWLATKTGDPFGKTVLGSVAVWLGIQTCTNVMMANASMPAIGIPIPFISSGGSSLVALWLALGVCQSVVMGPVAKKAKKEASRADHRDRGGNGRTRLSGA